MEGACNNLASICRTEPDDVVQVRIRFVLEPDVERNRQRVATAEKRVGQELAKFSEEKEVDPSVLQRNEREVAPFGSGLIVSSQCDIEVNLGKSGDDALGVRPESCDRLGALAGEAPSSMKDAFPSARPDESFHIGLPSVSHRNGF